MNSNCITFNTSYSKDKIDISYQVNNNSEKLIKSFYKLKKTIKNTQKRNLDIFYTNSLKKPVNKNIRKKILYSSEEKNNNSNLPNCNSLGISSNLIRINLYNNNNKSPIFNRSISTSNKTLLTLTQYKLSKRKNTSYKNIVSNKLSRNEKIDLIYKLNKSEKNLILFSKKIRYETISEFNKKNKEIMYSKYLKIIKENELMKLKEKIKTKIDSYNIEIFRLKRMINLLKQFINEENKYYNYLKNKIIKEKELTNALIEQKDYCIKKNFLLKDRLIKLETKFRKYLNNKFFLLCVKNLTNQIENFNEEDKKDYLLDLDSLEKISDFSIIQYKLENKLIKENKYSNNEIEIFIFGRKLFNEQKDIFYSIKDFNLKLNQIENNIENKLVLSNQSENELNMLRKEYKEKIDLFYIDNQIEKNINAEIKINFDKLIHLKFKNKYLKNYLFQIKRKIKNEIKNKNLKLVETKISEIYYQINHIYPIEIEKNYKEEKISIKKYLEKIEILFNQLLIFRNNEEKKNKKTLLIIQKNIERLNRKKMIENIKLNGKREIREKINKVIEKANKLVFKPYKRVQPLYDINFKKNKKNNEDNKKIKLTEYEEYISY